MKKSISWDELIDANKRRTALWVGAENIDLTFVGLEIGEEAGELQGAIKKLIRADKKINGNKTSREDIFDNLQKEIGDVAINIARLAMYLDIDVDACIVKSFNDKSEEQNLEVFL